MQTQVAQDQASGARVKILPLCDCPRHEDEHLLHAAPLKESKVGQVRCEAKQNRLLVAIPLQDGYRRQSHCARLRSTVALAV